jgi:hypothetical protein
MMIYEYLLISIIKLVMVMGVLFKIAHDGR